MPSTVDRKQLTRPIECELNGKMERVRKERRGLRREERRVKGKAEEISNHVQSLCDAQTVKLITANNTVLMATTSAATLEGLYLS